MTEVWLTLRWIDYDSHVSYGVFSDKEEAIKILKEELDNEADGKVVDHREMNPGYIIFISGLEFLGQVVKLEIDKKINIDV